MVIHGWRVEIDETKKETFAVLDPGKGTILVMKRGTLSKVCICFLQP